MLRNCRSSKEPCQFPDRILLIQPTDHRPYRILFRLFFNEKMYICRRRDLRQMSDTYCSVYETVGAGDGFNAGFLAGILEGRPIAVCGRMGGIVGALATESAGDYEGYPSRSKLERLLAGEEELYR